MIASRVRDKLKSRKTLSLSQILEGGIWNVSGWPFNFFFFEWMYACWMEGRFTYVHSTLCILTTYGWHIGHAQAGRELAEISRPNTQEPPIVIKVSWVDAGGSIAFELLTSKIGWEEHYVLGKKKTSISFWPVRSWYTTVPSGTQRPFFFSIRFGRPYLLQKIVYNRQTNLAWCGERAFYELWYHFFLTHTLNNKTHPLPTAYNRSNATALAYRHAWPHGEPNEVNYLMLYERPWSDQIIMYPFV